MSITEPDRNALYEGVKRAIGEGEAATLMTLLPPVGWADVATKQDLAMIRLEMQSMEDRFERHLAEQIYGVRTEISELRMDVEKVLREQMNKLVAWLVPTLVTMTIAMLGTSFATARLR